MPESPVLEFQVVASSVEDVKEALNLSDELAVGNEVHLTDGSTLKITDLSKSSGFLDTSLVVTGLVTIATTTTSAILIEWLKSRLFQKGQQPTVTIIVNGAEVTPETEG